MKIKVVKQGTFNAKPMTTCPVGPVTVLTRTPSYRLSRPIIQRTRRRVTYSAP